MHQEACASRSRRKSRPFVKTRATARRKQPQQAHTRRQGVCLIQKPKTFMHAARHHTAQRALTRSMTSLRMAALDSLQGVHG